MADPAIDDDMQCLQKIIDTEVAFPRHVRSSGNLSDVLVQAHDASWANNERWMGVALRRRRRSESQHFEPQIIKEDSKRRRRRSTDPALSFIQASLENDGLNQSSYSSGVWPSDLVDAASLANVKIGSFGYGNASDMSDLGRWLPALSPLASSTVASAVSVFDVGGIVGFVAILLGFCMLAHCIGLRKFTLVSDESHGPVLGGVRHDVEQLRVTRSFELRSWLRQPSGVSRSMGLPTRLQGRVVAVERAAALSAPFSGRDCVLFSASASRPRLQDGVYRGELLAFQSASCDFTIALFDDPSLVVAVQGHNAGFFDMATGSWTSDHEFSMAPDPYRSFVLQNLLLGSDAAQTTPGSTSLGCDGNDNLNFSECALVSGVSVTCVGELVQDPSGTLMLRPWRPAEAAVSERPPGAESPVWDPRALLSWRSDFSEAQQLIAQSGTLHKLTSLPGRVLLSDDKHLLLKMPWYRRVWRQ